MLEIVNAENGNLLWDLTDNKPWKGFNHTLHHTQREMIQKQGFHIDPECANFWIAMNEKEQKNENSCFDEWIALMAAGSKVFTCFNKVYGVADHSNTTSRIFNRVGGEKWRFSASPTIFII